MLNKIEIRLGLDTDIQELTDGERTDILRFIKEFTEEKDKTIEELRGLLERASKYVPTVHPHNCNINTMIGKCGCGLADLLTSIDETLKK